MGSSSAGWLWLTVFLKVDVKLLATAVVVSRFDWAWRIHFQAHSCGYWQVSAPLWLRSRGLPSHHMCLSAGFLNVLVTQQLASE
jgi:hypothetical protein